MSRVPNTTDPTYTNLIAEDQTEVINPNPWLDSSSRTDKNKIPGTTVGDDGKYDRYLISAKTGVLRFWNQITKGKGGSDTSTWLYSKGSGTYIDFTLSVKDATENQSVLYWCDDLDLPENEYWSMDPDDATQDELLGINYGPGGEGIVLGEGTDKDSVVFAKHTGLEVVDYDGDTDNYVIGTGTDPATSKVMQMAHITHGLLVHLVKQKF